MTVARSVLATCLMLAGCTAQMPPPTGQAAAAPASPRTAIFVCDHGLPLTVQFQSGTAIATGADGHAIHLAQKETGSGILYGGEGFALRGKGEEMTWTTPDGTSLACSAASGPLAGTRWELVQFQSPEDAIGVEKPPHPEGYVMELQAGGQLALKLDCNRATGRWAAHPASPTDGLISLSAPAMTRAAYLPGSWDTRLARDLGDVRSYVMEGDRLHLALKIDSGIYTWRRMSP